jgi:hypothetical protein
MPRNLALGYACFWLSVRPKMDEPFKHPPTHPLLISIWYSVLRIWSMDPSYTYGVPFTWEGAEPIHVLLLDSLNHSFKQFLVRSSQSMDTIRGEM